jgi:hypothetical protein
MNPQNFNRIGIGAGLYAPVLFTYFHNPLKPNGEPAPDKGKDLLDNVKVFFLPVANQLKAGDMILCSTADAISFTVVILVPDPKKPKEKIGVVGALPKV